MNHGKIHHVGWKHAPHGWKMFLKKDARDKRQTTFNQDNRARTMLSGFVAAWASLRAKHGVGRPPVRVPA